MKITYKRHPTPYNIVYDIKNEELNGLLVIKPENSVNKSCECDVILETPHGTFCQTSNVSHELLRQEQTAFEWLFSDAIASYKRKLKTEDPPK